MKKTTKRKVIAFWVIVPIATILAFMPKIIKNHKRKKYTTSF